MGEPGAPPANWRQLRAMVHGDPSLQERLAAIGEPEAFVRRLIDEAAARGVVMPLEAAAALVRPDTLGLARFTPQAPDGSAWPMPAWLPAQTNVLAPEPVIDWLHAGKTRPTAPFFSDAVRRLMRLPFNRAFRYRMTVADFLKGAEPCPAPDGLIFHMSRCGSTLASQMLAALPNSLVLSEPPPLDDVLQLCLRTGEDAAVAGLRAIAAAFGRRGGRPFVIKLDAWHALTLPLFRRAFPDTPWVFLYRDPVEVLVSQMRQRGTQMLPQLFPPRFWGIEDAAVVPDEDYCARVLAAICDAAADNAALGGGLMIDYRDLPQAVSSVIAPHFRTILAAEERSAMQAAARRDAKAPSQDFVADGAGKRREASEAVRRAAERHLASCIRRLDRLAAPYRISASMRIASPR